MTDFERLSKSTDDHEGFRSIPYKDTKDLWTFAKGRCLERNPLTAEEWKHLLDGSHIVVAITEQGANWLKWIELRARERDCQNSFSFWSRLNDARQNALIEMAYQMGMSKLKGFKKMLAAIESEDWQAAYLEGLDSQWHREDSPARAREVMLLIRDGKFPE